MMKLLMKFLLINHRNLEQKEKDLNAKRRGKYIERYEKESKLGILVNCIKSVYQKFKRMNDLSKSINSFDRTPSKIKNRDIWNRKLLKAISFYLEHTSGPLTWTNIKDQLINNEGV